MLFSVCERVTWSISAVSSLPRVPDTAACCGVQADELTGKDSELALSGAFDGGENMQALQFFHCAFHSGFSRRSALLLHGGEVHVAIRVTQLTR